MSQNTFHRMCTCYVNIKTSESCKAECLLDPGCKGYSMNQIHHVGPLMLGCSLATSSTCPSKCTPKAVNSAVQNLDPNGSCGTQWKQAGWTQGCNIKKTITRGKN